MAQRYRLLHDQNKICCFVGSTTILSGLWHHFDFAATKQQISFEDLQTQPSAWVQERQFMVLASDIAFKSSVVRYLQSRQAHFFSIIANDSLYGPDIQIGQGTFINSWNDLSHPGIRIGNHCIVTCFDQFADQVVLEDFCHVSAYCYLHHCTLGSGCVVGVNSTIVAGRESKLTVAPYSNVIMSSIITKSLETPGTYKDNRRLSLDTSLSKRIL